MIVKNESKIIERCLNSVKDSIDYWVICDTGSTDNTQIIIKEFFKKHNIPGELHEDEWIDFGYNRTKAFDKAKASIFNKKEFGNENKPKYYYVIDADDIYVGDPLKEKLTYAMEKDSYCLTIKYKKLIYIRKQLFNVKQNWRYVGVLHEFAECDKINYTKDTLLNSHVLANTEGARSKDPNKYKKDAQILLNGIKKEPNNARYYFYLANSFFDCNDFKNAKFYYYRRIEMKGWDEEVYYSMYRFAVCKSKLQITNDFEEVLYDYLKAFNYRKTRLEALYEIIRYYRNKNNFALGYAYGMLGYEASKKYPKDMLFINNEIHTYKFIDELSVCAWWVGNPFLSLSLTNKLLKLNIKQHEDRYKKNKDFSIKKIKELNIELENQLNNELENQLNNK
tara:strand:+ start:2671 stop:3849 length:1179 start_codon:yes stop_codon:yes gene_type:complete